jgi:hypothetical protein
VLSMFVGCQCLSVVSVVCCQCLSVVSVVCCQVEVSATDLSLVQRSPTDCGASLCVIKKPRKREVLSPLPGCENTTTIGCNARKTKQTTYSLEIF